MDALIARRERWIEIVGERDLDAYADMVTEDIVWLPPVGDAITGRTAFRKWLEPFFSAYLYDYAATDPRFRSAGEWAVEWSEFESHMTPVDGGRAMSHRGAYIVIWKLEPDRLWRIDRYVDQTSPAGHPPDR